MAHGSPGSTQCQLLRRLATEVVAPVDALLATGWARSPEYRTGMLDAMSFHQLRIQVPARYQPGSAQFDAWYAGIERGDAAWFNLAQARMVSHTVSPALIQ